MLTVTAQFHFSTVHCSSEVLLKLPVQKVTSTTKSILALYTNIHKSVFMTLLYKYYTTVLLQYYFTVVTTENQYFLPYKVIEIVFYKILKYHLLHLLYEILSSFHYLLHVFVLCTAFFKFEWRIRT